MFRKVCPAVTASSRFLYFLTAQTSSSKVMADVKARGLPSCISLRRSRARSPISFWFRAAYTKIFASR
ncbi:hypothetical protein KEJ47_10235 [Candidatus Bathyarchaeota archaeon]|nr:hypothetical protein [Candidatus Bathyarchaeota archaeon]